jgi:hypothetical protein
VVCIGFIVALKFNHTLIIQEKFKFKINYAIIIHNLKNTNLNLLIGKIMERLLVQIEYTDGFTFSTNDHVPVIFSSKEEFLITLEDTIKDNLKQIKSLDALHEIGQEKFEKLSTILQKNKKMQAEVELLEELTATRQWISSLELKIKNFRTIQLGGQEFQLSNFLATSHEGDERTEYIHLPQVFTLDEYFAHVEKNLTATPNKPKLN